jgi:amidase
LPLVGKQNTLQIRMTGKANAEHVEDFTLKPVRSRKEPSDRRRLLVERNVGLHAHPLIVRKGIQKINDFETLWVVSPIDGREIRQKIKLLGVAEKCQNTDDRIGPDLNEVLAQISAALDHPFRIHREQSPRQLALPGHSLHGCGGGSAMRQILRHKDKSSAPLSETALSQSDSPFSLRIHSRLSPKSPFPSGKRTLPTALNRARQQADRPYTQTSTSSSRIGAMRKLLSLLLLLPALSLAQLPTVTGKWFATADFYGTPINFPMELTQQGDKFTGKFGGDNLEGTLSGNSIHFLAKDEHGGSEELTGSIEAGLVSGSIVFIDADDKERPATHQFTATLVPPRRPGPPQRHEFTPSTFYRQFSAANKPVLTVSPGDTIHTTTVDAGGTDEKGVKRVLGGNPETGPFYIQTAAPGDTLVVHLTRLSLNRDWAISDDGIVGRGLDSDLAVKMKDGFKDVRWHLDLKRGTASPEKPGEHLTHYSVPLRPMLGCVAVAPGSAQAPPGTGDSGRFGGNMDFNEIVEGATIYLRVNVPGALLYVGDAHATQGDGELNGNALETSMDVEFTVDVISGKSIPGPRVESATHIMAMGLDGSLDDAFRGATANMAQWLTDDYKLTPPELAEVLGTAAEYKVSEVADRNAGIVV